MWVYVLILVLGIAVTIVGIRAGQRRQDDPFADDTPAGEPAEPEPSSSLREPTPLGTGETGATPVGGPRAPRATLKERLREARDARAAKGEEAVATAAASTTDTPTGLASSTPEGIAADSTAALIATTTTSEPATESEAAPASEPGGEVEAADTAGTAEPEPAVEVEAEAPTGAAEGEPEVGAASPPAVAAPAPMRVEIGYMSADRREGFVQRWTPLRMRLLARPGGAIADADAFVRDLLEARGLPSDPDDPAMADAANAYPDIVDPFRLATAIAGRAEEGTADPQQLRLATVHYRDTVDRLLDQ